MMQADVDYSDIQGLLRFGFHCYNDETDIERVIAAAREAS